MDELYDAKLLMLIRKVRFAEKVAADIGNCIDDLAEHASRTDREAEVFGVLNFYRGSIHSVHLLLESMFFGVESGCQQKPVDELCRSVRK